MSTHNLCFEQKYEIYQSFLSENFQFLEVKFSIYMYLNRCVLIMKSDHSRCHPYEETLDPQLAKVFSGEDSDQTEM